MKIYQGVDIVEISKLKKVFTHNKDFAMDIFTENERDYCLSKKDPFPHFAARFAAKEAGLKALGIGMSGIGIDNTFKEIEIVRSPSGKPEIFIGGWSEKICRKKNIHQFTVSLSHSANYAIATIIMTGT
jgi:holo-[acyl-carrier protein] synthase